MESYWNDETKQVEFHEVGSTRHAGGSSCSNTPPIDDIDMLVEAIAWLGDFIFGQIRAAEHRDVLEPQKVERGDMVRLIRKCKHKGVTYETGTVGEVVGPVPMGSSTATVTTGPAARILEWASESVKKPA